MSTILYSLSDISLVLGLLWLFAERLWGDKTSRDYFHTTKVFLFFSIVFAIVFYNKENFEQYLSSNLFTAIIYVVVGLVAYVWLSLTYRWFTARDVPAYEFCSLALVSVLCCKFIISAVNLGVLFSGLSGLALVNYRYLKFSQEEEEFHQVSARYGWSIVFFALLMLVGLALLQPENWGYQEAAEHIESVGGVRTLLIIAAILFFLLFMIGIAPFHFWFTDVIAPSVLPVAAYLSLVPVVALWTAFLRMNITILPLFDEQRGYMYAMMGIFSAVIGAVGAHSSRNIKKIFGYVGLYNIGMILLIFSSINENSLVAGLIYMAVYLLAILGIYTSFYSFKSSREYLNNLTMISGIASVRPYISAAMLLCIVSLMGIAPLPGFWGQITAAEMFMRGGSIGFIALMIILMLVLMLALARVIYTMYFAPRQGEFDRADRGIYVYLLIITAFLISLALCPEMLIKSVAMLLSAGMFI